MKSAITFALKGRLHLSGCRPYLWKLVLQTNLTGWVSDSASGILLHLRGNENEIADFMHSLPLKLPRVYHLTAMNLVRREELNGPQPERPFRLIGPVFAQENIRPDLGPCPECLHKMLDPASRYYRYPFIFCSKCGPSFSIALEAPFNRTSSSLRAFPACKKCKADENPYQLCPDCGPTLMLKTPDGNCIDAPDPAARASEYLAEGKIIAVKTYDGYFCICDAHSSETVKLLRQRKKMPDQPISLIARDVETVKKYVNVSEKEIFHISSNTVPIMLVKVKQECVLDLKTFAPDDPGTLGISLPPTALMRLLFERPGKNPLDLFAVCGGPRPVDPEKAGGEEDFCEVSKIADYILTDDLRIWQSGGPSVFQVSPDGDLRVRRRSRGVNPESMNLDFSLKRTVLALGTDEETAVALGMRTRVVMSQQIGSIRSDKDSTALYLAGEQLAMIFSQVPEMIICGMDLASYTANQALKLSERHHIPLVTVQRHHANALASLAENRLTEANALVFDGGGSGPDGTIWGAEALAVSYTSLHRYGTFSSVEMNHPASRTNIPALLLSRFVEQAGLPFPKELLDHLNIRREIYENWRNLPHTMDTEETHAALTVFEAAAALFGFAPKELTFSNQMLLRYNYLLSQKVNETRVAKLMRMIPYQRYENEGILEIDWSPFFSKAADFALFQAYTPAECAHAFVRKAASASTDMLEFARSKNGIRAALLSGKLFTCLPIEKYFKTELEKRGFQVYLHIHTSPGCASVCIGQAVFGGLS